MVENGNAENVIYFAATASGKTATITANQPGYYAVVGDSDADGTNIHTAVSLTTTDPNASVEIKVAVPSLEKLIANADNAPDGSIYGNGTAEDVGDDVEFYITSTVPDMTGYTTYSFVVKDTMSKGLTYNDDSLEITIDGDKYTDYKVVTETVDNGTNLTITFNNFINQIEKANAPIVITYTATVNQNALTVDHDTNIAKLEFSNNPNDEDSKGTTPDSTVYVYNCNVAIDKVDGNDTAVKLSGAEFVLYYVDEHNTRYYYKDNTDGTISWVPLTSSADLLSLAGTTADSTITKVTTNDSGAATFAGLDARTYYLKEIKAPDGYNLPTSAFEVTINPEYDSTGVITNSVAENNKQPVYTQQVKNNKGAILPTTGGMGTTLFYLAGGALAVGAAVLLITKKKMSVE